MVKRVADDVDGEICKFLLENHCVRVSRYMFSRLQIGSLIGPEDRTVPSSA